VSRGVSLQEGDRVISMGGETTSVYLTEQFFAGHMERKPRHEYWEFEDKEPSKVA